MAATIINHMYNFNLRNILLVEFLKLMKPCLVFQLFVSIIQFFFPFFDHVVLLLKTDWQLPIPNMVYEVFHYVRYFINVS